MGCTFSTPLPPLPNPTTEMLHWKFTKFLPRHFLNLEKFEKRGPMLRCLENERLICIQTSSRKELSKKKYISPRETHFAQASRRLLLAPVSNSTFQTDKQTDGHQPVRRTGER